MIGNTRACGGFGASGGDESWTRKSRIHRGVAALVVALALPACLSTERSEVEPGIGLYLDEATPTYAFVPGTCRRAEQGWQQVVDGIPIEREDNFVEQSSAPALQRKDGVRESSASQTARSAVHLPFDLGVV